MNDPKIYEVAALLFVEVNDIFSGGKKKKSKVDKLVRETQKPSQLVCVGRSQHQTVTQRVMPTTLTTSPALTTSVASPSSSKVEKALLNRDLYIRSFTRSASHRYEKYLWSGGCMYEGEWRKGKALGKGKFLWPSGATYEGDFKSNRMEGFGTFIESYDDTFIGDDD